MAFKSAVFVFKCFRFGVQILRIRCSSVAEICNYTITDEDGNEKSWLDDLTDDAPSIQSILEDRELLNALYKQLEALDPDGRLICELIMQGCPERAAAAKLGLSRNTFTYRRDKLLAALREALRDYN